MRRFLLLFAGLVTLLASVVGSSESGTREYWVITDIGPGAAVDINESGQVVGRDAFVWQNGKKTQLGTLGGRRSGARAINNRGQVVGDSTTKNGTSHAFLWQNGTMRDLGTLGGPTSIAMAINEHGQVVGSSDTRNGSQHAFLWHNGKMRDLGTLGGAYAAGSSAIDVNERGQVVGSSYSSTISYGQLGAGVHAFLWQNGTMRDLGTLGRNPPTSIASRSTIAAGSLATARPPATGDRSSGATAG